MRTAGSRTANGTVDLAVRSESRIPGRVVAELMPGVARRRTDEHWAIVLLALGLAGLLVAVIALCGLAFVSTWAPATRLTGPTLSSGLITRSEQVHPAPDYLLCCHEMQ